MSVAHHRPPLCAGQRWRGDDGSEWHIVEVYPRTVSNEAALRVERKGVGSVIGYPSFKGWVYRTHAVLLMAESA